MRFNLTCVMKLTIERVLHQSDQTISDVRRSLLRTKARIKFKKMERVHRQSGERIVETFSADQRKIMALSKEGYEETEIARELALTPDYVHHFMTGLVQRLSHDGLIPSPAWNNALKWAAVEGLLER